MASAPLSGTLEGKVAVITGAGSGMGRAAAQLFAQCGAKVALYDRDADAIEEVAAGIGEAAVGITCDVADLDSITAAVDRTVDAVGHPNVLYNNAGINLGDEQGDAPTDRLSVDAFDATIAINLRGVVMVTRQLMPSLLSWERSSVVNTASVSALVGSDRHAYAAAKGGVVSFTRSLALSYADRQLRANTICPGVILTPMVEFLEDDGPLRERYIEGTPMNRLGEPLDVALLARYLASDESSFVTGAVITVDGGLTVA